MYNFDFIGIRFRGDKVSFVSSGSRLIKANGDGEAQNKLYAALQWGHFDEIHHSLVVTNRQVKTPRFPVTLHI
jgi:hypothetical protein